MVGQEKENLQLILQQHQEEQVVLVEEVLVVLQDYQEQHQQQFQEHLTLEVVEVDQEINRVKILEIEELALVALESL